MAKITMGATKAELERDTTNAPTIYFKWWEFKKDLTPCTLVEWCPVHSPCTICAEHQNARPWIVRAIGIIKWHVTKLAKEKSNVKR